MTVKANIVGFKVKGRPFLGIDDDGADTFGADGIEVARWLAYSSRARFNQQRSLRSKYVYEKGVRVLDADGKPALAPLGSTVTDLSHAAARREFPFMAAVPAMALEYQKRDENESWFAAAKRRKTNSDRKRKTGGMPRFKSRRGTALTFGMFVNNGTAGKMVSYTRTGRRSGIVSFGGVNPKGKQAPGHGSRWSLSIRVRLHPKQVLPDFTSIQVNLDTMRIVFTAPPKGIHRTSTGAVVGVKVAVATSSGDLIQGPDTTGLEREYKNLQRRMARSQVKAKAEGRDFRTSHRYQRTRARAARASAAATNHRQNFQHQLTHRIISDHDMVAVEDLNLAGMMKSAKGTAETPGRNVSQKKGLNRGLATMRAGSFFSMLEYKAKGAGVHFIKVNPRWTSQRCNKCGHISAGNREKQADFHCLDCGHADNADTNAAINILDLAVGTWDGTRPKQARKHQPGTGTPVPAAPARTCQPTPVHIK